MDDFKESLGKTLRTAREAAGISMDDAVYLGKMPRDVIQALESEDFGFFNSPLYARSFLQQYGNYVGVDVELWLDDIEPTAMIDGDDLESLIDLSAPTGVSMLQEKPKKKKSSGSMAAVWLVIITGGLIFGGVKVYESLDQQLSVEVPPVESSKPPADTPEPETEEIVNIEPVEEKKPALAEPEAPKRAIVIELPED
ncbi:MAG: helix-turn-helix domain-containing protein [Luteolibacter sp.]